MLGMQGTWTTWLLLVEVLGVPYVAQVHLETGMLRGIGSVVAEEGPHLADRDAAHGLPGSCCGIR